VEATRVTVCSCENSASRWREIFTTMTSERN
jgi:hypothetical protein